MYGDDDRFFSVAMQVAAHEARLGHGKLAEELRAMIDDAEGRRSASPPVPIGRPRGELANLKDALIHERPRVREADIRTMLEERKRVAERPIPRSWSQESSEMSSMNDHRDGVAR